MSSIDCGLGKSLHRFGKTLMPTVPPTDVVRGKSMGFKAKQS